MAVEIEALELTKHFRIPARSPGLVSAARHLIRPRYDERIALDRVNFVIEGGESVAYVGPNGAGKSTTLKLLTGILVPSSGEVRVRGLVPHRQRVANARNIGVVFGQRSQLWWDLPVQESLRLLGDVYEVPRERFAANLRLFVDLLDLEPLLRTPTRQLSLGQRMRCDLVASLLHGPSILYLDEPTIGLDVGVKARIRHFIKEINREHGVTVLLTSHDLGDIEDLCRRLIMIDRGGIVFDGPLAAIKDRFGRSRVVHFLLRDACAEAGTIASELLRDLAVTAVDQPEPHRVSVQFDAATTTAGAVASRLLPVLPVDDLRIEEPSVESIIRRLYEGELRLETAQ